MQQAFVMDENRPTMSLTTRPDFPYADKKIDTAMGTSAKLNPILSNLLPEGALRSLLTQGLKDSFRQ